MEHCFHPRAVILKFDSSQVKLTASVNPAVWSFFLQQEHLNLMQQCTLMPEPPQTREQSFGDLQTHLHELMTRLEDQPRKGISGRAPSTSSPAPCSCLNFKCQNERAGGMVSLDWSWPISSGRGGMVLWCNDCCDWLPGNVSCRMPCGIIQSNVLCKRVPP